MRRPPLNNQLPINVARLGGFITHFLINKLMDKKEKTHLCQECKTPCSPWKCPTCLSIYVICYDCNAGDDLQQKCCACNKIFTCWKCAGWSCCQIPCVRHLNRHCCLDCVQNHDALESTILAEQYKLWDEERTTKRKERGVEFEL